MFKAVSKLLKILLLLFLLFVISVLLVSLYVTNIGKKYIAEVDDVRQGDAIIVLGAAVYQNGTVSEMLKDRLDFALTLYEQKSAPKILVSGDHGQKDYDEVNAMRKYLLEHGVPSEDIFMDHAGFNTYYTMYRAKYIFCVEKPIVVSQRYHVIRANYIGKKLGMDVVGVGADTRRYLGMAKYELREYASRYKAFLECFFKTKPKYMGEQIPVWGNGEVTLD